MSDQPVTETTETVAAAPKGGLKGFFATTVGKIVVIGLAVTALLTVIGIVAFIVLGTMAVNTIQDQLVDPSGVSTQTPTGGGAVAATATAPVPDIQNRDVFTPRNPFTPLVLPASFFPDVPSSSTSTGTSGGSSGGGSTSTSETVSEQTLVLDDIITDNGTRKAVLTLGGTQMTVAAGEQLGSSPWRVISVGTTSVTLLYGDEQVVLSVGQGISTK